MTPLRSRGALRATPVPVRRTHSRHVYRLAVDRIEARGNRDTWILLGVLAAAVGVAALLTWRGL